MDFKTAAAIAVFTLFIIGGIILLTSNMVCTQPCI